MNRIEIVVASLALFVALAAGCGAGLPGDVGAQRSAKAQPWTCAPARKDDACMACQRASCCAEVGACMEEAECARLFACTITERQVCGGGTAEGVEKLVAELACWNARCANVCPNIHGGST